MAAVLIGAGIAAGVKWFVREMARSAEATRLAHEELSRRESNRDRTQPDRAFGAPKDLGKLEYDPATGVYRPVRKHI
jgi:hypothetical protein